VEIYETYCPGGIVKIELETEAGADGKSTLVEVWSANAPSPIEVAIVFRPKVKYLEERTIGIKLTMDCTQHSSWQEIDAIRVFSAKPLVYLEHVPMCAPESYESLETMMLCCRYKYEHDKDNRFYLPRETWDHIARHLFVGSVSLEDSVTTRIVTPEKPKKKKMPI